MKYIKIGSAYQCHEEDEIQSIIKWYRIDHPLYELHKDGRLIMKKFYTWDGPTGAINTKSLIISSGYHDILCEMINASLLPPEIQTLADEQFMILNRKSNVWAPRRMWTYLVVRWYQIRKKYLTKVKVYEI